MRGTVRVIIGVLALAGAISSALAQSATLKVPVISDGIVIDGHLNEPAWARAAMIDEFYLANAETPTPAKTEARVIADGKFLYVGFHCVDKDPAGLVATATADKPYVWNDDSIEFFLNPGSQYTSLMQFGINCKGILFQDGSGPVYKPMTDKGFGMEYKVSINADSWDVEFRLPLDRVGLSLAAYQQTGTTEFQMHFARDLRNKAYAGGYTHDAKGRGYFDQRGWRSFRFEAPAPAISITGVEKDQIVNQLALPITLANAGPKAADLQYTWFPLFADAAKPVRMVIPAGKLKAATLSAGDILPGIHIYRLEVSDGARTLFVKDIAFSLDAPVEIAPTFPVRSIDDGEVKDFRLLIAPHIIAAKRPYIVDVVINDQNMMPVFTTRFNKVTPELRVPFTAQFAKLKLGAYTAIVTLRSEGQPLFARQYAFFKGLSYPAKDNPRLIIKNGDFEDTTTSRPPNWVDSDTTGPYPAFWWPGKAPKWWSWGDLEKDPRSVHEGKRSVILQGRGVGAELHLMNQYFKVNLKATYQVSFVARGRGIISERFYIKNAEGKWMNRYFDTRNIALTDDWTEYVFDPIDFNTRIDIGWDMLPLGENNLPDTAVLVLSVHGDSLAYVDNVTLVEQPR